MQRILAFLLGLLFALGLGIAGMTKPSKIVGFLDLSGAWDPSLLFVMAGAVAVYAVAYRRVIRRDKPVAATAFVVPTKSTIDPPLVIGAVLFGVGWGLGGFCPGPSLVTLASGSVDAAVFVAAMVVGMLGYSLFEKNKSRALEKISSRRRKQGEAYAD